MKGTGGFWKITFKVAVDPHKSRYHSNGEDKWHPTERSKIKKNLINFN